MANNYEEQANEQETTSRPRKSGGCGSTLLYLICIFGISVIISLVLLFSANDVFAFIKDNRAETITVTVPTMISDLSKDLDKKGVINYGTLFKLFIQLTGKDTQVSAGDYELNASMDYRAIVSNLKLTDAKKTITITIPEGYTVQQIHQMLLEKEVCTRETLNKALTQYRFKHESLAGMTPSENWLEGYLFPDTYEFYKSTSDDDTVQIINRMLNNFETKYDQKIIEGANKLKYSMHEIVTIASMVEREAQVEEEFAKIAGVIHNRLNSSKYPYLQIDATLQYAVGHKDVLTNEDKEIDSPYNTYKYKGLPPGPIANPGYTALYAASHPESHSYYYYVAMPNGSHLFAKTLSQHNKNIETAKAAFAEASE